VSILCPACGAALRVCPACSAVIAAAVRPGRPRVYCSARCRWRQGHAAARQRARARAPLTPGQVAAVLAAQAARAWTPR
jgi:hypothetical protein